MDQTLPPAVRERRQGRHFEAPEIIVDFEADNALLRAALARSEGDGVRRELVTRELEHRIGNLLAVVTAIARHTFRNADVASVQDFSARLYALGEAQKLLINAEKRPAMLVDVITAAVSPHCEVGELCTLEGPDIALDGRHGHALTLALHELATNAGKYGALSVEGGRVEIVWTVHDGQFDFVWREHGGPPAVAPVRRGFGTTLISRNLGLAFGGTVDLDFAETGFACRLRSPTPHHMATEA
jgi:two-component sensor histidine kinase